MSPNQGGIETFMMNVFLNLEGHGFHFEFLNIYKQGIAYTDEILNHGGTIRNLIIPTGIKGHLIRKYKALSFFKKYRNYYDIVHVNAMSINAIFWLKIANKFNINKLIIQSHVDNRVYNSKFKKLCTSLLTNKSIHYLKKHPNIIELAVNKESGEWMFRNKKFHVICNGIDTDKFQFNKINYVKLKNKLHIKQTDKVVIAVARLSYQKNYFKIIRIFYYIYKLMDGHVKLVIVGDGKEKDELLKLTRDLHLSNAVLFLGSINDVYNVLSIADLMLMPSRYEGFPFCLIEGQAVGVPALVSKAIPKSSNVTGHLKYLSINQNNVTWANEARNILSLKNGTKQKIEMNTLIKNSNFNINKTIRNLKSVYLSNN